ncbi:MAG: glycosyltransferase [Actinomycetia bacterium]|nr:glycosyltransferase [Actinomycetes bacterium]
MVGAAPPPALLPWTVGIVVPARNEEALIGRCLEALAVAVTRLHEVAPGCVVDIVVVLDSCTDRTAERVAQFPGVRTVSTDVGTVGGARALGVASVTERICDPRGVWIACTDADSAPPPDWLVGQLTIAEQGHALVAGVVYVDPDDPDLPRELVHAVEESHSGIPDGHEQVHGANLGFTLQTYLDVGGFAPVPAHEDVLLVGRARSHGVPSFATGALPVLTSARLDARAPEGFSAWLREQQPREDLAS